MDTASARESPPRVVLLDQRDSFTHNLAQLCAQAGAAPEVLPLAALELRQLHALCATHVILGPGPGHPAAAADALRWLRAPPAGVAVLGVCLGHQQIGCAHGASIVRARALLHGRCSALEHDGRGVFARLPRPLQAMRYHSLVVAAQDLPAELEASAHAPDGELMGLRHRTLALEGVQFHPESFLSAAGLELLGNFLSHPWRGADRAAEA